MENDVFELEDYDLVGTDLDTIPVRLQEYDPSDFMDPTFAMALVRSLKIENKIAGKRSFQVRKETQEALEYLVDMYPEYSNLPAEEIEEVDDLTIGAFAATDTVADKTAWLKSLYKNWVNKRIKEDARVHVVANPVGDGFALDHVNPSLGFVNSDIYDVDPSGIKSYATYDDVLAAVEFGSYDIVDVLPEDRFELEDVELFDNIPPTPEQIRSSFSAKSVEILDKQKKWPRLGTDQDLTGWEAMEIARGKGYQPEIIDVGVSQTEFWMISPSAEGEQRLRLRKAEFDYLKKISKKASVIPVVDLSDEQRVVLISGGEAEKQAVYRTIGQELFEGIAINDHDAQETGKTYRLYKEGLLKENDLRQYFDKLVDRHKSVLTLQKENKNPVYAAFTTTGLAILDKKKRWPKLDKEKALTGWEAMELAYANGFDAVSIAKEGAQNEFWLTHLDENIRDIRIKKTEFEYFDMVKHGEVEELSTTNESQVRNSKIEHLLSLTWPTPSEIILENELAWTNTTSEVHRAILEESVAFLKENRTLADKQMQSQGYVDDQLASAFHSLPSSLGFERTLRSKNIAKCYNGDVYTLSLDDKLCCTGNLYKKTGEIVDLDFGKNATLNEAIEQIKIATYASNQIKTTDKELYELSFRDYVRISHSIDVDKPSQLSGVSGTYIYAMMQEWADVVVEGAINGGKVPESSLIAVRGAAEQEFVKLTPEQKNVVYGGSDPAKDQAADSNLNQAVPFPFEMTKEEFRNYYETNKENLAVSVASHVDAFHSTPEAQQEAKAGIEAGIYVSEADYIHKQSVKDCLDRHLGVEIKILADYPDLTAPLPPVWSVPKKEFMNNMGSYRKAAECTDQEFLKAVVKGDYHKQEVQKALDAGFSVPNEVIDDYPDLDLGGMRQR